MTQDRFLRLHTLQAGHGDCLVIEYGDDPKQQHVVVIDGGVAGETTPALKSLLKSWPDAQIDLLVVSHIDDDHIVGAIRLLKDTRLRRRIKDIWFNGAVEKEGAGLEGLGFKQGDKLEEMLADKALQLPWNRAFGGADVVVNASKVNQPIPLPLGASITLLSPTVDSLRALREAWAANAMQHEEEEEPPVAEPHSETPPGLERMGGGVLPAIDVDAILQTTCDEDHSIANGSSIAFLFSFGGASLLLAADAHANVLLETAALLDGGLPRSVEVLKLPHHGSAANVTADFLKAFPTEAYVISTNGNKHGHPNDLALARIVVGSPGSKVLFNYPGAAYKRWLDFSTDNLERLDVGTTRTGILEIDVKLTR
ncbi:ComEC/Rec2 family competence protein [Variovorax sp. LARHSF232]